MSKYAIIAGYDGNKVLTRVWIEAGKVKTDNPVWYKRLKEMSKSGIILGKWDSEEFLKGLANHFKSGYLMARKIG